MKKIFLLIIICLTIQESFSWGFWAHKKITSEAINLLPNELYKFYNSYRDSIVNSSINPDLRRNFDKTEAPRHFIDFEYYETYPFKTIPHNFNEAKIKFGDSLINAAGCVPWHISDVTKKLEEAFKQNNIQNILFYSSELAHYIGDAHVPLHTTINYDGQLTNQNGLHARWESEIPERYNSKFNLSYDSIGYVKNVEEECFKICIESYKNVSKVLSEDFASRYDTDGTALFKETVVNGRKRFNFENKYYDIYYAKLDGMVESRMEMAANRLASFWFTAWVNAQKNNIK